MHILSPSIDFSKVHTIIYHMPDGQSYAVSAEWFDHSADLGVGEICDTSEVDGLVHFFPRGNC